MFFVIGKIELFYSLFSSIVRDKWFYTNTYHVYKTASFPDKCAFSYRKVLLGL